MTVCLYVMGGGGWGVGSRVLSRVTLLPYRE